MNNDIEHHTNWCCVITNKFIQFLEDVLDILEGEYMNMQ